MRPGVDPAKAAIEIYTRLAESVRYLFLAHGAGLVFSISAIKDLKDVPSAKGIGEVAGLFAIGFAVSVICYVILVMERESTVGSSLIATSNPPSQAGTHGQISAMGIIFFCATVSVLILIFNTLFIAYRVWSF